MAFSFDPSLAISSGLFGAILGEPEYLLAWGVYGGFLPDFEGLSSPSEASDSESDRVSGLRLSGRLHYLLRRPGKPVWHNAFVLPLCAAVLPRNVYGKAVCAAGVLSGAHRHQLPDAGYRQPPVQAGNRGKL